MKFVFIETSGQQMCRLYGKATDRLEILSEVR
jgi:hypothetical protein